MVRVLELAATLIANQMLSSVRYARITPDDVSVASEALIVGTTTDVTYVRRFEKHDWKEIGPVGRALRDALLVDIRTNPEMRLEVEDSFGKGGEHDNCRPR